MLTTKSNKEETKKALMKLDKETIINLYISAQMKADQYDIIANLIRTIIESFGE